MTLLHMISKLDHYDAYVFVTIGMVSMAASLGITLLNLSFEETRRFPNNLLILASIAQLGLAIHWFVSGLYSPYISGVPPVHPDSFFCRFNSVLAFFLATAEFMFNLSFVLAITFSLKNVLKKSKEVFLFWAIPLAVSVVSLLAAHAKGFLGMNIYGTCSVRESRQETVVLAVVAGVFVIMAGYAVLAIRSYIAAQRRRSIVSNNFFGFYLNYTLMILVLYFTIGSTYALQTYILTCVNKRMDIDNPECYRVFFMSKIVNTVKVFLPLWTFLARIRDPFYQRLVRLWLSRNGGDVPPTAKDLTKWLASKDPVDEGDHDDLHWQQREQVRKGMIRTILTGLIYHYDSARNILVDDNTIHLSGTDVILSDSTIGFTAKMEENQIMACDVAALGWRNFQDIVTTRKAPPISPSLNIRFNHKQIENCKIDGGAGGEFMMATHDKKLMIKTLTEDEMTVLLRILPQLRTHCITNNQTLLSRILGVFEFNFKVPQQTVRVFVMENLFEGTGPIEFRIFDLKGSKYDREVLSYSKDDKLLSTSKTLKDIDWVKLGDEVKIDAVAREYLKDQLRRDVTFLKTAGLIDYSLLVGIAPLSLMTEEEMALVNDIAKYPHLKLNELGQTLYVLGIIDYLQEYTWGKAVERWWKKVRNFNLKLDTSSANPTHYANRFLEFVKSKVLV